MSSFSFFSTTLVPLETALQQSLKSHREIIGKIIYNKNDHQLESELEVSVGDFKCIAVLGAGNMGAKIAAHFANAGFPIYLFDLATEGQDRHSIIRRRLHQLAHEHPEPLMDLDNRQRIIIANYDDDLAWLEQCDLVIEAIAENLPLKQALYQTISGHLNKRALLATNTSGLSINQLSAQLPEALQTRFFGMHFFNPPRYMPLVELIASGKTDTALLQKAENLLVNRLGKTVLYAKDTANFIANRIGTFALLCACHYAEKFSIPFDIVDQLTGRYLGRPKSATFRTLDLVGLDVFAQVVSTMSDLKKDPWLSLFQVPKWIQKLIEKGRLGQKTHQGIYHKTTEGILVLNPEDGSYALGSGKIADEVKGILKQSNVSERFTALRDSDHPQARFLWACHRELFLYCAYSLGEICDTTRELDLAMRLGFAWQLGPFELWQSIGWQRVIDWIADDIQCGHAMTDTILAKWVKQQRAYDHGYTYNMPSGKLTKIERSNSYQYQLYPPRMLEEPESKEQVLYDGDAVCLWSLDSDIGIVSFKTKMNVISDSVLEGLQEIISIAEEQLQGLVIWQKQGSHFSAGADLMGFAQGFLLGGAKALEPSLCKFQQTLLRVRYSSIPVVAATFGYVLGGGCELMMHCDHVVAAAESYIGLVESGVGIIPGGGGCKEMAKRAARTNDAAKTLQDYYRNIALAKVATSAYQAKKMGYLRDADSIVMNKDQVLFAAIEAAKALRAASYSPPLVEHIPVAGIEVCANIQLSLVNMLAGGFISQHDMKIANQLAFVMTGGELNQGEHVDEKWFLRLEREAFLALVETEETQARVQHMLETGKPLRN